MVNGKTSIEHAESSQLLFWIICLIGRVINYAALGILAFMAFLVCADVGYRAFLGKPIKGLFEITEIMMVLTVFFGLAYTAVRRGNIRVSGVVSRFTQRIQLAINSVTNFLCLGIFAIITWQSVL